MSRSIAPRNVTGIRIQGVCPKALAVCDCSNVANLHQGFNHGCQIWEQGKKTLIRKQLGVQAVLIVRRGALPRTSVHGGETTGHEISQKLNDKVLS